MLDEKWNGKVVKRSNQRQPRSIYGGELLLVWHNQISESAVTAIRIVIIITIIIIMNFNISDGILENMDGKPNFYGESIIESRAVNWGL